MPWVDAVEVMKRNPPTRREIEQVIEYQRRKAKPRFYSDENFPPEAVRLVRAKGVKALTAKEAGQMGHPDVNHA
jgi:hypothetical protein